MFPEAEQSSVVGQHSRITVQCYTLTLQCFPLRDFGGEQFHGSMSCDFEVTNESASC